MEFLSRSNRDLGGGRSFDVVVIGSGYGGGVAACRLAAAGKSVCVLERGRERRVGDYPTSTAAVVREIQAHGGRFDVGSATGLFDFRLGKEMSVLVGCGLGGTSQINANVMLEPSGSTFVEGWPAALRNKAVLDPHYLSAYEMLGVSVPLRATPKLHALESAAVALGAPAHPSPVAVRFSPPAPAGDPAAHACTGCGNCVTGCNQGAKNTVLMNYLPAAVASGAQVFTEVQVERVSPGSDGRWRVHARTTGQGAAREVLVEAEAVVVAAGALGSTEILTRSAMAGLPMSREIGRRFSGNGDFLGVAYDGTDVVDAMGHPDAGTLAAVGPCISGTIDLREGSPDFGAIVQDGAVPAALTPLLPAVLPAGAGIFARHRGKRGWRAWLARAFGVLQGPYRGPTSRTLTLLLTSKDDHDGVLKLRRGRLAVSWPAVGCRPSAREGDELLQQVAGGLGSTYLPGPWWLAGHRLVTVHPLGGCVMADRPQDGVVDHLGRVFTGKGEEVYAGLHVLDGSIVPRPLGVNPALTITALAERAVATMVGGGAPPGGGGPPLPPAAVGLAVPVTLTPPPPSDTPGLRWDERLAGTIEWREGPDLDTRLELRLTVQTEDIERMLDHPEQPARITGTVVLPPLSSLPLQVTAGVFQLFVDDPDDRVDTRRMRYSLDVEADGRRVRIDGQKEIRDDRGFDCWHDLTTLPVVVRDRDTGVVLGTGDIRLDVADVAALASSIRVLRVPSAPARALLTARFLATFGAGVIGSYGKVLSTPWEFEWLRTAQPVPKGGRQPLPTPQVRTFVQGHRWVDGPGTAEQWPTLRLTRYEPKSPKGSILLAPGFAMRAASFRLETTEENLTEHLYRRGYDVWLFDWRASFELPSATSRFTLDDVAHQDWPTAVAEVRRRNAGGPVHLFGHCMGSTTALMATAAGMEGVRSIVCSQNTLYLDMQPFSRFLARSPLVRVVQGFGFDHIAPPNTSAPRRKVVGSWPKATNAWTLGLDLVYRLNPLRAGERCHSPICRWVTAYFGPTHRHERLDNNTHTALKCEFGPGDLDALRHIALMVSAGKAVSADGRVDYMDADHLRVPILFLAGEDNRIFLPSGARKTYTWLRKENPDVGYEFQLLKRYGHLDALVGRHAHEDVFPLITDFLDRH